MPCSSLRCENSLRQFLLARHRLFLLEDELADGSRGRWPYKRAVQLESFQFSNYSPKDQRYRDLSGPEPLSKGKNGVKEDICFLLQCGFERVGKLIYVFMGDFPIPRSLALLAYSPVNPLYYSSKVTQIPRSWCAHKHLPSRRTKIKTFTWPRLTPSNPLWKLPCVMPTERANGSCKHSRRRTDLPVADFDARSQLHHHAHPSRTSDKLIDGGQKLFWIYP